VENQYCIINVRVLAHWLIQRFEGEAILASADPRYVVGLLLEDSKAPYSPIKSKVELTTYRVAFFAIGSITKVFLDSDIIGKEYKLRVDQTEIDGRKTYSLGAVE